MKHMTWVVVALLTGCATRYAPAPSDTSMHGHVGSVRLINDQADKAPRVFASDGIITTTTNYRGWADVFISRLEAKLSAIPLKSTKPKVLRVSVPSIMCTGSFLFECTFSAQIERGDGGRQIYTSPARNGYPMDSAFDKALNDSVRMVLDDDALLGYLEE